MKQEILALWMDIMEKETECHKEKSGVTNSAMKVKTLKKLLSCYKTPKVLALKINFRWE